MDSCPFKSNWGFFFGTDMQKWTLKHRYRDDNKKEYTLLDSFKLTFCYGHGHVNGHLCISL